MAFDDKRFPKLIQELYRLVGELETMFAGRPFTPDGHMVGSLAECFAEYYYGLNLYACSNRGHDARATDCDVEIKATQGNSVSLRTGPDRLLVFRLFPNGSFEEIYNGPGAPVWALVMGKPKPSNGQYRVSLSQLRKLMDSVPPEQRCREFGEFYLYIQPSMICAVGVSQPVRAVLPVRYYCPTRQRTVHLSDCV